jgi:DNA mismatch repair protein MutS2
LQRENQRQAEELAQEKKKLQTEWTFRQRARLKELEQQFADAIEKHEKETARAVAAVKEREMRAQLEKQSQRQMTKARVQAREDTDAATVAHLSESQADLGIPAPAPVRPISPEQLAPGVRVRVRGLPNPVTLRRRDGASAEVEAGALRMKVALADIIALVEGEMPAKAPRPMFPKSPANTAEPVASEINVIGCTVEEASGRVDKFLDQSALAGSAQVRVIHGHGTGALRRGLAEFLKTHPLVASIHAEAEERGGAAVTVVQLKE